METQEKVLLNEIEENPFLAKNNAFPKEGLALLKSLFEFYSNGEYKSDSLSKVYEGFCLSSEIKAQLTNSRRNGASDSMLDYIQRDLSRISNILRLEIINRIKSDFEKKVDFEIPELYFRFKFCSHSEFGEGPGNFPETWEGKWEFCREIKDSLLELLVLKIQRARRISQKGKQYWYKKLTEFYNPSDKNFKNLEEKMNLKILKGHKNINEQNLIENKGPFVIKDKYNY